MLLIYFFVIYLNMRVRIYGGMVFVTEFTSSILFTSVFKCQFELERSSSVRNERHSWSSSILKTVNFTVDLPKSVQLGQLCRLLWGKPSFLIQHRHFSDICELNNYGFFFMITQQLRVKLQMNVKPRTNESRYRKLPLISLCFIYLFQGFQEGL